jgi:DedD protein
MGLMSFFKRGAAAPAAKPVADSADAVQQLRLRARRRLIGAAVLVGIGVIGFPLIFETQPRPIPVDLPIEIPRREGAAPPAIPLPTPKPNAAPPVIVAEAPEVESTPAAKPVITETAAEQGVERKPVEKPVDKSVDKAAKKEGGGSNGNGQEAARVQALLEGKPATADKKASDATASGGRFIVQVGAYADSKAAQEARLKVERMGLKTYTQAVETADGKRIRVRVGPFASRDEADKVAAKVRGGGLSTAVLTI